MIVVGIAEMKLAEMPETLVTYALGSCVGVCIYDLMASKAGMLHVILPNAMIKREQDNIFNYADTGIPEMVRQLLLNGCLRYHLKAKIAGGAKMFEIRGNAANSQLGNIGERNVQAVKKILFEQSIPLMGEETGANYGRTMVFSCHDCKATISSFTRQEIVL